MQRLFVFLVALSLGTVPAHAGGRSTVVLELFTSEGCSSCPPADDVLARLERTQPVSGTEIVPLSFHVDYWNQLGWTDPYSSPDFSLRQEQYSDVFGGDRVYTPQMVVDGSREFVGNESLAIKAIAAASTQPKATIAMSLVSPCGVSPELKVSVGTVSRQLKTDAPELLIAMSEDGLTSEVKRGENAGRTLHHTAVVRKLRSLGEVKAESGKPFLASTRLLLDKAWKRGALRVVAFLQEKKSHRIIGAAALPMCEAAQR